MNTTVIVFTFFALGIMLVAVLLPVIDTLPGPWNVFAGISDTFLKDGILLLVLSVLLVGSVFWLTRKRGN